MNFDKRTPRTIEDAIEDIVMSVPINLIREKAYVIMKDFISNKIQGSMGKSDEFDKLLEELFERLTQRKGES